MCSMGEKNIIFCTKIVRASRMQPSAFERNNVINRLDFFALEYALQAKEKIDGKLIAICMSPLNHEKILQELYAYGVDKVILISDKKFAGSDTYATANILAQYISMIDNVEMIFCGYQSVDGETAQVPIELGEKLGMNIYNNVTNLLFEDNEDIISTTSYENVDIERIVSFPALFSVNKSSIVPRIPGIREHMKVRNARVLIWSSENLQGKVEAEMFASKTKVEEVKVKQVQRDCMVIENDIIKSVKVLKECILKNI